MAGTRSLTRRTLIKVALRIATVVTITTIVSYWHVGSGLRTQALEQLENYVEQRRARESAIFTLASDNLDALAAAFIERLDRSRLVAPRFRFDAVFEPLGDGTVRLTPKVFDSSGITGFIGKHVELTSELQAHLVAAFDTLAQFGPAWRSRFVNLYAITPDNAILMYWPEQAWALTASDWEVYGKLELAAAVPHDDVIVLDQDARAEGGWSQLYFDYGVNDWMVSVTRPVERDGRHLLSVGHDILLRELFERTLTNELDDTYNLIFTAEGKLIAHPRFMDAIQARSGALTIAEAGDPHLERIYEIATDDTRFGPTGDIVRANPEDAEYLAVTRIAGPEWYLVTVFPESIVAGRALETARLVLILGVLALVIEIAILFSVLRDQVARPLEGLIEAARRIAAGSYQRGAREVLPGARDYAPLAVERSDEIGELARSFRTMAHEIDAREAALNERSARLADVNAQLAHELEERKRVEAEIARQRDALHQSEKLNALGSLLAGVAHELNNPLSVVVGRTSLLTERLRGTPDADSVTKIRAAAERCARIVKTFLAMARQQHPSREAVAIGEIVQSTLDVVGYGMRRQDITVELEIEPDLPLLSADPNQLIQVLTNLLVNAQQALEGQPPPRRVRIGASAVATAAEGPEHVLLTVADNGSGIPEEVLPRIFEPFFTTKGVGEGTGLGLSVCRGLIEAHGGSIDVVLPPAGGTRFEIRLPIQSSAQAQAADQEPEHDSGGAHILVVEDEAEVAQMMADVLAPRGYRVEIAGSGRIALERLERTRFDLVLSDLRMPDLDGPALFRELLARDPEQADRFVFVTGDSLSPVSERFLAGTHRPVIEKPFTPDEIRRVVEAELAEH